MKSFLQLVEEQDKTHKPVVMAFGRMNPPTSGHLKLIDKVRELAAKHRAAHTVIASHSQDSKKNPLTGEQKVKHLQRYSPGTHFETSSKEHPTFLHHAAKLNAAGHDHLIYVAGSDRVKEMHDKLHQYNGTHKGALYNFKKISVVSAGHRDPDAEGAEGMSGTKMREHASNNDFHSFRQGVPEHVPDHHARELMRDTRKGMGLNENIDRGLFKAIFITGGPGSGKDIVIREAIAENKAVEINSVQAFDYLMDKQKLSEKSNDLRREAIRNRGPLIINGPADDHTRIITIKEELEELGYETVMVFVETSNETSKERNEKLTKMVSESVRKEKWQLAQTNKEAYVQNFNKFINFDNSVSLELVEQNITDTYNTLNKFIDTKNLNETSCAWLENHGKLNINDSVKFLFKEDENVKKNTGFVPKINLKRDYKHFFKFDPNAGGKISADNRAGESNADNIKWDGNKKRGGYTGGSGATYTEETTSEEVYTSEVNTEVAKSTKEKDEINIRESNFMLELKMNEMVGELSNTIKLQNEIINKKFETVDNVIAETNNAVQESLKTVMQETSDKLDKIYSKEINIPAPIINVPAPVVNVSLSEQKKVVKTVDRNSDGLITKITEETDDTLTKDS